MNFRTFFKSFKSLRGGVLALVLFVAGCGSTGAQTKFGALTSVVAPKGAVRFAVIGDFGYAGKPEEDVANLVKSWKPDFVITVGDNNYPTGAAATIDANIGQYYSSFIAHYKGKYGKSAATNNFFPTLGNHDWGNTYPDRNRAKAYFEFFTLPGNERYYDFARGPVHLFALDSDPNEPDGTTKTSKQAAWLKRHLAASKARWNIVYFHHAPYSSGAHGSTQGMQWPFQRWGATAVLAGHDHLYERIVKNGFPYFVNGVGGRSLYNFKGTPLNGSQARYSSDYGAMLVAASETSITFEFYNRASTLLDTCTIRAKVLARPQKTNKK